MIGLELMVMSQIVYLSYGLSKEPTYLGGSVKKMTWVSGWRDFYYYKEYSGGYREEYGICWQFMENNVVWLGIMAVVIFLILAIKLYLLYQEDSTE